MNSYAHVVLWVALFQQREPAPVFFSKKEGGREKFKTPYKNWGGLHLDSNTDPPVLKVGSWTARYCHPCHFTHSGLFPHTSDISLRSSTQVGCSVSALGHGHITLWHHLPPKNRGLWLESWILDGSVLSSMSFHPLRTLPPPIWYTTEVIHTGGMQCKCTWTRSHRSMAPPPVM